jgi:hypothetical protein
MKQTSPTDRPQHTDRPTRPPAANQLCPRKAEILLLDLGEVELLPPGVGEVLRYDQHA